MEITAEYAGFVTRAPRSISRPERNIRKANQERQEGYFLMPHYATPLFDSPTIVTLRFVRSWQSLALAPQGANPTAPKR